MGVECLDFRRHANLATLKHNCSFTLLLRPARPSPCRFAAVAGESRSPCML